MPEKVKNIKKQVVSTKEQVQKNKSLLPAKGIKRKTNAKARSIGFKKRFRPHNSFLAKDENTIINPLFNNVYSVIRAINERITIDFNQVEKQVKEVELTVKSSKEMHKSLSHELAMTQALLTRKFSEVLEIYKSAEERKFLRRYENASIQEIEKAAAEINDKMFTLT